MWYSGCFTVVNMYNLIEVFPVYSFVLFTEPSIHSSFNTLSNTLPTTSNELCTRSLQSESNAPLWQIMSQNHDSNTTPPPSSLSNSSVRMDLAYRNSCNQGELESFFCIIYIWIPLAYVANPITTKALALHCLWSHLCLEFPRSTLFLCPALHDTIGCSAIRPQYALMAAPAVYPSTAGEHENHARWHVLNMHRTAEIQMDGKGHSACIYHSSSVRKVSRGTLKTYAEPWHSTEQVIWNQTSEVTSLQTFHNILFVNRFMVRGGWRGFKRAGRIYSPEMPGGEESLTIRANPKLYQFAHRRQIPQHCRCSKPHL